MANILTPIRLIKERNFDELYKEEDRFGASLAERIEFPYNKKLMEKFLGLTVELMNIVLDEIIEEFNKLHKDGNN